MGLKIDDLDINEKDSKIFINSSNYNTQGKINA